MAILQQYSDLLLRGRVSVGYTYFTGLAKMDIAPGSASLAPLRVTPGTLLSSTVSGAIENDGDNLYWTDSDGVRSPLLSTVNYSQYGLSVLQASRLSTGRYIGIGGGVTAEASQFNGESDLILQVSSVNADYLVGSVPIDALPTGTTSSTVALGNHMHLYAGSASAGGPATTALACTGNSDTATKLETTRALTIGNTAKNFDGSAAVSWTLAEIGAASSAHTHSYLPTAGGTVSGELKVGTSRQFIVNRNGGAGGNVFIQGSIGGWAFAYGALGSEGTDLGGFGFRGDTDTLHRYYIGIYSSDEKISILSNGYVGIGKTNPGSILDVSGTVTASSFSGVGSSITSLNASNLSSGTVPIARLPVGTASTEVAYGNHTHSYSPTSHASSANTYGLATASLYGHAMASSATPLVAGTASVGTDNGKFAREDHVHPAQTSVSGSSASCTGNAATATSLATARTLTIGSTGKPFDGTAPVSWSLAEIGANQWKDGQYGTGSIMTNSATATGLRSGDEAKPYVSWAALAGQDLKAGGLAGSDQKWMLISPSTVATYAYGGEEYTYNNATSNYVFLLLVDNADFIGSTTAPFNNCRIIANAGTNYLTSYRSITFVGTPITGNVYPVIVTTGSSTAPSGINYTESVSLYAPLKSSSVGYTGNYSVASGQSSVASGKSSVASGNGSVASGSESVALGRYSVASGASSVASGDDSVASGGYSVASGANSVASGAFSVASGYNSVASGTAQTVIGKYNVADTSSAFIIGNGTSTSARSNCMTVDFSGNMTLTGALTGTSATFSSSVFAVGGTFTGAVCADAGARVSNVGASWISGKTSTNCLYGRYSQTTTQYHPFLRINSSSGNVFNLGGLGNNIGFYGYYAERTENGTDWSTVWDTSTGALTHNKALTVSGATVLSSTLSVSSTVTFTSLSTAGVVHNSAAGVLSTGKVALASEVSGTLGVGNGGTGRATLTANSLLYGDGTSSIGMLAIGGANTFLKSTGSGYEWVSIRKNDSSEIATLSTTKASPTAITYVSGDNKVYHLQCTAPSADQVFFVNLPDLANVVSGDKLEFTLTKTSGNYDAQVVFNPNTSTAIFRLGSTTITGTTERIRIGTGEAIVFYALYSGQAGLSWRVMRYVDMEV